MIGGACLVGGAVIGLGLLAADSPSAAVATRPQAERQVERRVGAPLTPAVFLRCGFGACDITPDASVPLMG